MLNEAAPAVADVSATIVEPEPRAGISLALSRSQRAAGTTRSKG
jgi:hypothetical protein